MGKHGLGEFEFIVLLAVLRLGPEAAHPIANVEDIRAHSGRRGKRAAVYVTLQRLEQKGLVASWLAKPDDARGGKRRRFARVLPAGRRAMREARATLEGMWQGLDAALEAE
ncbi:MAG: PadR family transcriptional regulator [Acidobacteria bacterium]|nr:PadR family transcriptional regulator [Acidobacteriota bacterium]